MNVRFLCFKQPTSQHLVTHALIVHRGSLKWLQMIRPIIESFHIIIYKGKVFLRQSSST